MKNQSKKVASTQKTPIYTKFGIAIIVMLVSIYIFNPDILLKGTVSLVNRPEIVGDLTLRENTTMKTQNYTSEMKDRAVRS